MHNGHPKQNGQADLRSPAGGGEADGIERLQALLRVLWSGKWILLAVFVLVVGAVAAHTFTQTPKYSTSTSLLVDLGERQSAVPSLTGGSSSSSILGGEQRNLSNQVYMLNRSGSLAREVAHRLDTMDTHPGTGEPIQLLRTPTGERRSLGAIAGAVKGRMQAQTVGREVDAIQISATSSVPGEAALIANQYAMAYIDRTREQSRETLVAKRKFLERQSEEFEGKVQEADRAMVKFMQEEDAVGLDQESSRLVDQLSELEARRDELRIKLKMAESTLNTKREELRRIRPRLAERLSSGTQAELSQVQEEKATVEAEINRIRARKPNLDPSADTPQARDLRALQRRAQRLDRQADSLAEAYVERALAAGGAGGSAGGGEEGGDGGGGVSYVVGLQREIAQSEIEVNGLQAQLQTVERRIQENQSQLQNLPPKSLQLADLKRRKQSLEQIQGFLRQKLQETRMAEESEVGFAEQVERAGVPGRPVAPNTRRNLILGALLGLLLGGGLVVLRERLDKRIRTPGDLEALGEQVLGVVPSFEATVEGEFGEKEMVTIDGRDIRTSLIMLSNPTSAAGEAYRRLRTNLRFARPDADLCSVVVTSPGKGEGKTTTATNLAIAQAQAGRTTLLIDADLRKSRIHRFFDVPRRPGLTEALYDPPDPADIPSPADDLCVLPGGEEVPNPAELLGAQRMRRLLGRMEEAFDLVIVDTSPVLLFSDPGALATHTDGVLLVAEASETDGPAFEQAAARLDHVEAGRLGAVLNGYRPDHQRGGYGYGYGYGYRYGYGYGYDDEDLESYYDDEEERTPSVGDRVRTWWSGSRG